MGKKSNMQQKQETQQKQQQQQQQHELTLEQLQPQEPLIDFDAWFCLRQDSIPSHHHKEIIMADFKARGLSMLETISSYDEALRLYGIKI
jgi:hypothetical protein